MGCNSSQSSKNELSFADKEKRDKFVCILIDTTDSMRFLMKNSAGKNQPRFDIAKHLTYNIIGMLSNIHTGYNNNNGIPIISFASGTGASDKVGFRGYWNLENFKVEYDNLGFGGHTFIKDAWNKMTEIYDTYCKDLPPEKEKPLLMPIVITDGELRDGSWFENTIEKLHGIANAAVVVIGDCEDSENAFKHYTRISNKNSHVLCVRYNNDEASYILTGKVAAQLACKAELLQPIPPQLEEIDWDAIPLGPPVDD